MVKAKDNGSGRNTAKGPKCPICKVKSRRKLEDKKGALYVHGETMDNLGNQGASGHYVAK